MQAPLQYSLATKTGNVILNPIIYTTIMGRHLHPRFLAENSLLYIL